ncbi:hypothetical protein WJX73_001885 [Symbiochloris irregularis]|uniref:Chlorophyllase n=1 Tax=Symbiochloris irregularis TaxID=706552 RepID=A0AAW1PIR2_9CHLO
MIQTARQQYCKLHCSDYSSPVRQSFRAVACSSKDTGRTARRRDLIAGSLLQLVAVPSTALAQSSPPQAPPTEAASVPPQPTSAEADYTKDGPYQVHRLPRLEHTCAKCFPACTGSKCLLRLDIFYPKRRAPTDKGQPFPLAVFTGGFLVAASSYVSYAQRLASWGWVTVLYDKAETALDNLDDILSVNMISEIIDWAKSDPLLGRITNTDCAFLCGHSRGGKLSVLAAARDERVKAVCLLDPVDNTVWAPLGPGYPSAVKALQSFGEGRQPVPLAVVGSGLGGDCVPSNANFRYFYNACTGPSLQVALRDVGHFQFLDKQDMMQRSVCAVGSASDAVVQHVSQAVVVAWGEAMCRQYINDSGSAKHGLDQSIFSEALRRKIVRPLEMYATNALQDDLNAKKGKKAKPKSDAPIVDVTAKNFV